MHIWFGLWSVGAPNTPLNLVLLVRLTLCCWWQRDVSLTMTGPACRVWGDTSMYCVLAVLFSPIPALLGVIVKASWTFASSSNSSARARLMRYPLLGRCVWSLCCSLHLPPPETDWVLELVRGLRRSAPPPLADTQTSAAVCLVNGHTSNYWDGHARTATYLHFQICIWWLWRHIWSSFGRIWS